MRFVSLKWVLFSLICSFSFLRVTAQVEIVGHRGAAYDAPENTLISAQTAVDQGADAFEIDIHMSSDGQLVVIHDGNTKRTTGVDLVISQTPYEKIRELDAGSFKAPKFKGEQIPLLQDILDFLPEGISLYIEIKGPAELVPVLTQQLHDYPKRSQINIIAFDLETITMAKEQNPDLHCYYLKTVVLKSQYKSFVEDLRERNLDGADLHFRSITPKLVKMLNHQNMICLAWTVNAEKQADKLIRFGVSGITTDRPGWLRKQL